MTGLSGVAGTFAALMVVVTICCACRLVAGRVQGKHCEPDVDALHVLMGVAMAGMFEPRLSPLPGAAWQSIFAVTAAWFAWQAIRGRSSVAPGHFHLAYPLPHAVESAAMIYMLRPYQAGRGTAGMAMSAMTGQAASSVRNPMIPLALAMFMLGYILWTADHLTGMQLASRRRRPRNTNGRPLAAAPPKVAERVSLRSVTEAKPHVDPGRLALAPRLAASYKIAMGVTMGYMLVSML